MTVSEHPLDFFENLLQRGGLQDLHEEFKPSEDDRKYGDIGYDEVQMCKVSGEKDPLTGEVSTEKDFFCNHLKVILNNEVFEARKRLINRLDSTNSSRQKLIENFIIRLNYFIKTAKSLEGNNSSLVAKLPLIREYLIALHNDIQTTYANEFPKQSLGTPIAEIQTKKTADPVIPFFNKRVLPDFLKLIQDFFEEGDRQELRELLESGKKPSRLLCFDEKGNRLADAFKRLKESDLISKCNKEQLAQWIVAHFTFKFDGNIRPYNINTLRSIISANAKTSECKYELFTVIADQQGDKKLVPKTH